MTFIWHSQDTHRQHSLFSITGYNRFTECISSINVTVKNMGIPIVIILWSLAAFTFLDIFKYTSVQPGVNTPLWSQSALKSIVDSFFYVILSQVVTKMFTFYEGNSVVGFGNIIFKLRTVFDDIIDISRNVSLNHCIWVYVIIANIICFFQKDSYILLMILWFVSVVFVLRTRNISEHNAIPGEIIVHANSHGYINVQKTPYTNLETIIRADWVHKYTKEYICVSRTPIITEEIERETKEENLLPHIFNNHFK